jgi:hypothetical protein
MEKASISVHFAEGSCMLRMHAMHRMHACMQASHLEYSFTNSFDATGLRKHP